MENKEEPDRITIREELSHMSFEELQNLKQKLGTKCYNFALFGDKIKKSKKSTVFKRENKNRPREVSSKIPVKPLVEIVPVKKTNFRDPRFDSLCGSFNEKAFENSYSFLKDVKEKEKQELLKKLKTTRTEERQSQIKYLIQRLENQEREHDRRKMKDEKKKQERKSEIDNLRQGIKPKYVKKSERKMIDLVDRFEELKKSGKLKKQIEKQRKKNTNKDRKKLPIIDKSISDE
uniref:rRNA biogenesis protein RRP36 n=1 Tax=Clastoptera arizonana TaxID=38151 RepID=A0A1B6CNM8_9HEMI